MRAPALLYAVHLLALQWPAARAASVTRAAAMRAPALLCAVHLLALQWPAARAASGCTDPAALNAAPAAMDDDGSCEYSCEALRDHAASIMPQRRSVSADTKCFVHNHSSWGELESKAAADPLIDCANPPMSLALGSGDSWVVQGRSLAGAPRMSESSSVLLMPESSSALLEVLPYRVRAADGGQLALRYVRMMGNWGHTCVTEGGYISVDTAAQVGLESVFFDGETAGAILGGAILTRGQASVSVTLSTFHVLQSHQGGAVWADSSTLIFSASKFHGCSSTIGGGGIYAASCSLTLSDVAFQELHSTTASTLAIVAKNEELFPPQLGDPVQFTMLVDTTFDPFDPSLTVFDNSTSVPGGCIHLHPCDPGFSCSYDEYSLKCTPCPVGTRSADGLTCTQCQPGEEPNRDSAGGRGRTACQTCPTGTYSPDGRECRSDCAQVNVILETTVPPRTACVRCPAGTGPSSARTQCVNCASGQFSTDGVCRDCLAPTVSSSDKMSCVLCPAGTEPDAHARDEVSCRPCDSGSFSTFGVQCQPCVKPAHTNRERTACINAEGTVTLCNRGEQLDPSGTCVPCPAGKFSPYGAPCEDCTGDTYVIQADRSVCAKCPSNKGLNTTTRTCDDCIPPLYAPGGGQPCKLCAHVPNPTAPEDQRCVQPQPGQVYSPDRRNFTHCGPGTGPNENRTECVPCPPKVLSRTGTTCNLHADIDAATPCDWDAHGMESFVITQLQADNSALACKPCEHGQKPNSDHSACVAACHPRCGRCTTDGQTCLQCDYAGGFYNSTEHLIVLCDEQYSKKDAEELRGDYYQDKETEGHCQLVPEGVDITADGQISLQVGYSIETDSDEVGEVWSLFRCPERANCLGGVVAHHSGDGGQHELLPCANGHAGPLCKACAPGRHMPKGETSCDECEGWFMSIFGVNLLRFILIGCIMTAMVAVIQIWEYNDSFVIHTLKRGGVWSTLEVFIGFCQIAALFVKVSAEFDSVFDALPFAAEYHAIVNMLSVNLPSWLTLDCLAVNFYTKWTCKAVGVPALCFLAVYGKYRFNRAGKQCCKTGRVKLSKPVVARIALAQRATDMQFAMFVSYTSVFNSVLHVMICRQVSPNRFVLDADFDVPCNDPVHNRHRMYAACLTFFLVLVPVRALWYTLALPRRTRICRPCQHNQALVPWAEHLRDIFSTPALEPLNEVALAPPPSDPAPMPEPEPEPEAEPGSQPKLETDRADEQHTSATGSQLTTLARVNSPREAEIMRLRREREEHVKVLLQQKEQDMANLRQRNLRKLAAVDALVARFNHADVLKLMSVEMNTKFSPPRALWRRLCSTKTNIDDLDEVLEVSDWVQIQNVVRRAHQPWAKLLLMELTNVKCRDPRNVVAMLVQNFSAAEILLLVNTERPHCLPAKIKEINRHPNNCGRFPISKQDWTTVWRVVHALSTDSTFHEGREFFRPVDFLRKVLVLCCAFEGGPVSRPMFAAFVSLGFAFVHIRVWPYRRSETNIHKAISDFTISFVFYLCSIKAANKSANGIDPEDETFRLLQMLIVCMWRVAVPLSLIYACVAGVRRQRRVVRRRLRHEMGEGGQLFAVSEQTKERILNSVGSLESLARLDEMTWFHRRVCWLRRRSSLRERILCSCETDYLAARCAESSVMLCHGQDDHAKLLACRRIPFAVQERLDKVNFESEADREIARSWIRTESKLDSLRDNWHVFVRDSPLTEQGLQALRHSLAHDDDDVAEIGAGAWLAMDRRVGGCCCRWCHREPVADERADKALLEISLTTVCNESMGAENSTADQLPRLMATFAAEAGDRDCI